MRIYVVSDTHGYIKNFLNKIKNIGDPDLIIHLGDYVRDGEMIEEKTGIQTIVVRGNGDFFERGYKDDMILNFKNKVLFLTHGHKYRVRYGIDGLFYKAKEVQADIALFGHTHTPILMEESKITIMNPGSPYQPRGPYGKRTFGIIEIDKGISGKIVEID